MAKRRLAPHEKKALSYARDRRIVYGENDKSSRKAIPLRKRLVNKANRHAADEALAGATGAANADAAEAAEEQLLARRPKRWKKTPDGPLREWVARQQARREQRANRG